MTPWNRSTSEAAILARGGAHIRALAERQPGLPEASLDVLGAEEGVRVVAVLGELRAEERVGRDAQQLAGRVRQAEVGPRFGKQGRDVELRPPLRRDLVPVDPSVVGADGHAQRHGLNAAHQLRLEEHLPFAPVRCDGAVGVGAVRHLLDDAREEDRASKEEDVRVLHPAANGGVLELSRRRLHQRGRGTHPQIAMRERGAGEQKMDPPAGAGTSRSEAGRAPLHSAQRTPAGGPGDSTRRPADLPGFAGVATVRLHFSRRAAQPRRSPHRAQRQESARKRENVHDTVAIVRYQRWASPMSPASEV